MRRRELCLFSYAYAPSSWKRDLPHVFATSFQENTPLGWAVLYNYPALQILIWQNSLNYNGMKTLKFQAGEVTSPLCRIYHTTGPASKKNRREIGEEAANHNQKGEELHVNQRSYIWELRGCAVYETLITGTARLTPVSYIDTLTKTGRSFNLKNNYEEIFAKGQIQNTDERPKLRRNFQATHLHFSRKWSDFGYVPKKCQRWLCSIGYRWTHNIDDNLNFIIWREIHSSNCILWCQIFFTISCWVALFQIWRSEFCSIFLDFPVQIWRKAWKSWTRPENPDISTTYTCDDEI